MRNSDKNLLLPDEITRILTGQGAGSRELDRMARVVANMQAIEWKMVRRSNKTAAPRETGGPAAA